MPKQPKHHQPALRDPKRRGEWVEMQFMARAAQHGLTVSKPWGDSARYDFIVEHLGRLSRVQVKSTSFVVRKPGDSNPDGAQRSRNEAKITWVKPTARNSRSRRSADVASQPTTNAQRPSPALGYRCNVVSRQFHRKTGKVTWRSYTAEDVDFLAIYVLPEDLWYVIPMSDGRKFSMMLYPYLRGNKAFPYLEAWHRMK